MLKYFKMSNFSVNDLQKLTKKGKKLAKKFFSAEIS